MSIPSARASNEMFHHFPQVPPEIRELIWGYTKPSARVIEVYPRPSGRTATGIVSRYTWYANKTVCKDRCLHHRQAFLACKEAYGVLQKILASVKYEQAFDTWINWDIDIIFISDRAGELHNTQFLDGLDTLGGLRKLKHLAIDDRVWEETREIHGTEHPRFKNCSPLGMLRHIQNLETLTLVGVAGFWRDGSELFASIDFKRSWLDTPTMDGGGWSRRMPLGHSLFRSCLGNGPFAPACSNKPIRLVERENSPYLPNGGSGLALVDLKSIQSPAVKWRCQMYFTPEKVEANFKQECLQLTDDDTPQDWQPDEEIDWAAWKPPVFKTALLRRTAPSCYVGDWSDLEKSFVSMIEASGARCFPDEYAKFPPVKAWYAPDDLKHLVSSFKELDCRPEKIVGENDV